MNLPWRYIYQKIKTRFYRGLILIITDVGTEWLYPGLVSVLSLSPVKLLFEDYDWLYNIVSFVQPIIRFKKWFDRTQA